MGSRTASTRSHGDICDPGLIERALSEYEVDSVFHLAAQTLVGTAHRAPVATFETNIRGTWLLLEACRQQGVESVIVASSDKAYGPAERLPYTEDQGAGAALSLRRLQGRRGPDHPLLLAHVSACRWR